MGLFLGLFRNSRLLMLCCPFYLKLCPNLEELARVWDSFRLLIFNSILRSIYGLFFDRVSRERSDSLGYSGFRDLSLQFFHFLLNIFFLLDDLFSILFSCFLIRTETNCFSFLFFGLLDFVDFDLFEFFFFKTGFINLFVLFKYLWGFPFDSKWIFSH